LIKTKSKKEKEGKTLETQLQQFHQRGRNLNDNDDKAIYTKGGSWLKAINISIHYVQGLPESSQTTA